MNANVACDLSRSSQAFAEHVWPAVATLAGGGELVLVEAVTQESFAKEMSDVLAGVDAWQVRQGEWMRGLASRVQFGERCWRTFTIRYKRSSGAETEYAKRLRAIEDHDRGFLYPHLTIHAYVNGNDLLGAAVCKTRDLILTIRDKVKGRDWSMRTNGGDGNQFAVVPWASLGDKCKVFEPRR